MSARGASHNRRPAFPLLIKLGYCAFVAVHLAVNLPFYGPLNYLWFCDIALLTGCAALWFENRLLLSATAVSVMGPALLWSFDYLFFLIFGRYPIGMSQYMSDDQLPVMVRAVSTFHLWLPVLLCWMIVRIGYDRRALLFQTVFAISMLVVCRTLTAPPPPHGLRDVVNINSVYGNSDVSPQTRFPAWVYLARMVLKYWLAFYLPTHLFASLVLDRKPKPDPADADPVFTPLPR